MYECVVAVSVCLPCNQAEASLGRTQPFEPSYPESTFTHICTNEVGGEKKEGLTTDPHSEQLSCFHAK